MLKINKNLIFGGLVISFFALLLLPISADAYVTKGSYTYTPSDSYVYYNSGVNGYGNTYTNNNSASPMIYSINPIEVERGASLKEIIITGTGFAPDSIARWNGQDRPTYYSNSKKLTMRLDPSDLSSAGKYEVSIVNPSSTGGAFSNSKIVNVVNRTGSTTTNTTTRTTTGNYYNTYTGTTASAYNYQYEGFIPRVVGLTTGDPIYYYAPSTVATVATPTVATRNYVNYPTTYGTTAYNYDNYDNYNDYDSYDNTSLTATAVNTKTRNFMPDTLLEWIIMIGLLILAVIIFRRLWVTPEEYHAPLKHN